MQIKLKRQQKFLKQNRKDGKKSVKVEIIKRK